MQLRSEEACVPSRLLSSPALNFATPPPDPGSRGRRWDRDFGEPDRVFILIDRDILALPIGQRRGARRKLQVPHASDHDGMGMALDDILDFTVERGQCSDQERHPRRAGYPVGTGKPVCALQARLAGKSLGDVELIRVQYIDAEEAVLLQARPR